MFPSCANGVVRMRDTLAADWRAEVWGSPIRHSLSPALHNAAYGALGLSATYSSREVASGDLASSLAALTPRHRGVSLTMPLKEAILPLVDDHRGLVDELGAANTVVLNPAGWYLWNTDPAGVAGAFADAGIESISDAVVLGAGPTARAVVSALPGIGATALRVVSRSSERASATVAYANGLGLQATWCDVDELSIITGAELVVSTLPPGVGVADDISAQLISTSALFDVTYDPWPSALAMRWTGSGNPVVSGKSMLLHQAVAQIRLFVSGNCDVPLEDEAAVILSMRAAMS